MQVLDESAVTVSTTASLTLTLPNTTAANVTAARGMVVAIMATISGSLDPARATPAGWSLHGPPATDNSGGTTKTGLWFYKRRGDGTTNSVTFTGTNTPSVQRGRIWLVDDVDSAEFLEPWANTDAAGTLSGTSLSVGPKGSTRAGAIGLGAVAMPSAAGGTGVAWSTNWTAAGSGSGTTMNTAVRTFSAADEFTTPQATWTTAGVARMAMVIGRPAAVAGEATLTASTAVAEPGRTVTLTLGGGTTTAFTQTAGPTVTVSGSGATRTFTAPGGLTTTSLTFSHTVSGDPTPATVTIQSLRDVRRVKQADGTFRAQRERVI